MRSEGSAPLGIVAPRLYRTCPAPQLNFGVRLLPPMSPFRSASRTRRALGRVLSQVAGLVPPALAAVAGCDRPRVAAGPPAAAGAAAPSACAAPPGWATLPAPGVPGASRGAAYLDTAGAERARGAVMTWLALHHVPEGPTEDAPVCFVEWLAVRCRPGQAAEIGGASAAVVPHGAPVPSPPRLRQTGGGPWRAAGADSILAAVLRRGCAQFEAPDRATAAPTPNVTLQLTSPRGEGSAAVDPIVGWHRAAPTARN
jgi:hypothetical protein